MTAVWIAVLIVGSSLVVLAAVVASGLGPLRSLTGAVGRFGEVRAEAERVRRQADLLQQRTRDLRERTDQG